MLMFTRAVGCSKIDNLHTYNIREKAYILDAWIDGFESHRPKQLIFRKVVCLWCI